LNILYLHGFGSEYNPASTKVAELRKLGAVFGIDLDYTLGFQTVLNQVQAHINSAGIDLVVGTSMGGYLASHSGLPFVAINPAVSPSQSLNKYLGEFTDYQGVSKMLTIMAVDSYPDVCTTGVGMVLLDQADEVIDAHATLNRLREHYEVIMYAGGNHRFEHMDLALDAVRDFCDQNVKPMMPSYLSWSAINELAVKQANRPGVYVSNNLSYENTADQQAWQHVQDQLSAKLGRDFSYLLHGGMFLFDTEAEAWQFYRVFEHPAVYASGLYAVIYDDQGLALTENT
jgi:uncharacterized protein